MKAHQRSLVEQCCSVGTHVTALTYPFTRIFVFVNILARHCKTAHVCHSLDIRSACRKRLDVSVGRSSPSMCCDDLGNPHLPAPANHPCSDSCRRQTTFAQTLVLQPSISTSSKLFHRSFPACLTLDATRLTLNIKLAPQATTP
jgi:hypothetical protein